MPTDRLFRTHVFVPHTGQFVINELPILVLCCAGWVFGGIDGLPFTTLSMWVALLLSLFLVYRFIYDAYAIASGPNSSCASMASSGVRQIIWNYTVSWTSRKIKACCSSFAG